MESGLEKDPTKTFLADGRKIGKHSAVANAIGTVDEVNAFVGLARVFSRDDETRRILMSVQRMLFRIGSEFASGPGIRGEDYEWLISTISEVEGKVKKPKSFVVLEKDEATAFLSVARAVVRRCERLAAELRWEGVVSELAVEWLNKLSYLLYLLILKEGRGEFDRI